MKKNIRLPKEFKKYFWDVDFKTISPKRHIDFVLSRIMSLGMMKDVRWMLNHVSARKIKSFIVRSGDRQLDRRSNNFWRIFFDLPPSRKPANTIWPY